MELTRRGFIAGAGAVVAGSTFGERALPAHDPNLMVFFSDIILPFLSFIFTYYIIPFSYQGAKVQFFFEKIAKI